MYVCVLCVCICMCVCMCVYVCMYVFACVDHSDSRSRVLGRMRSILDILIGLGETRAQLSQFRYWKCPLSLSVYIPSHTSSWCLGGNANMTGWRSFSDHCSIRTDFVSC